MLKSKSIAVGVIAMFAIFFQQLPGIIPLCHIPEKKANSSPTFSYLNGTGTVKNVILPCQEGRIKLNGVYWFAYSNDTVCRILWPEEKVVIVGRSGTRLIVEPAVYSFSQSAHDIYYDYRSLMNKPSGLQLLSEGDDRTS